MKRMLNGYILCEDTSTTSQQTAGGFEIKSLDRFKKVKVKVSNDEDINVGDEVLIPINSGEVDPYDENTVIIRRNDIIYIF